MTTDDINQKYGLRPRKRSDRNPYSMAALIMAFVCWGLGLLAAILTLISGVIHESLTESFQSVVILLASAVGGMMLMILAETVQLLDRISRNTGRQGDKK